MRDEEFVAARLDTAFISRFNERRSKRLDRAGGAEDFTQQQDMAIIAAALAYVRRQGQSSTAQPAPGQTKWKNAGRVAGLNRKPKRRAFERG